MKHARLYATGLMLFGITALGIGQAWAMTGAGPYYAAPSWDQTIPGGGRFLVLTNMNGEAVLDKETGLVWEKSPSGSLMTWEDAQTHCNQLAKGGRMGWRLPTVQELTSLLDPAQANPALPNGHPFSNVLLYYWSAVTWASDPTQTLEVWVGDCNVAGYPKTFYDNVWCVRGGQGVDLQ